MASTSSEMLLTDWDMLLVVTCSEPICVVCVPRVLWSAVTVALMPLRSVRKVLICEVCVVTVPLTASTSSEMLLTSWVILLVVTCSEPICVVCVPSVVWSAVTVALMPFRSVRKVLICEVCPFTVVVSDDTDCVMLLVVMVRLAICSV